MLIWLVEHNVEGECEGHEHDSPVSKGDTSEIKPWAEPTKLAELRAISMHSHDDEKVSNAVENLQPENVSIINTEGKVLSAGIF